jgi:hypothetical protein
VLKDVRFQLQQREALSPRHKLSTISRLPIPWMDFHPTSSFGKNSALQSTNIDGNSQNQMEDCRIHLQLLYGWSHYHFISRIWSVNQHPFQGGYIAYRIAIGNFLHHNYPNFTNISFQSLGNKGKWVYCKHHYHIF